MSEISALFWGIGPIGAVGYLLGTAIINADLNRIDLGPHRRVRMTNGHLVCAVLVAAAGPVGLMIGLTHLLVAAFIAVQWSIPSRCRAWWKRPVHR